MSRCFRYFSIWTYIYISCLIQCVTYSYCVVNCETDCFFTLKSGLQVFHLVPPSNSSSEVTAHAYLELVLFSFFLHLCPSSSCKSFTNKTKNSFCLTPNQRVCAPWALLHTELKLCCGGGWVLLSWASHPAIKTTSLL